MSTALPHTLSQSSSYVMSRQSKRPMFLPSGPLIYRVSGKCAVLCAVPLTYSLLTGCFIYSTKHLKRILHRTLGASIASLRRLFRALLPQKSPYETFKTRDQEDAYWRDAEAGLRELSSSDARFAKGSRTEGWNSQNEKQLLYYTPRLLPQYRDKRRRDYDLDFHLPTKAVMEWHHLVFPGRVSRLGFFGK